MTQTQPKKLGIIEKYNDIVVSSQQVAEVFERKHFNIIRDIEEIKKNFNELNFEGVKSSQSKSGRAKSSQLKSESADFETESRFEDFYHKDTYKDKKGEKRPLYYMNQQGFTLLVMGYTGSKAFAYKLAYIEAFEKMKEALEEDVPRSPLVLTPEFVREQINLRGVLVQPKDEEMNDDYYCYGIYALMKYYGYPKLVTGPFVRSVRPKVMEIGLPAFEEIVNYCAVKGKLRLSYVQATLRDFYPSEVESAKPPVFGMNLLA